MKAVIGECLECHTWLTGRKTQICSFVLPSFNDQDGLHASSVDDQSHREIKDHMSSSDVSDVFDHAEQTRVCAELADIFDFLILFEIKPKIFRPGQ